MTAIASLWRRGAEFLGTQYAILAGAMTWVSEHNLVAAISNAGGFGVLACGSMSPELLRTEIQKTQALTKKPFGVNLILMHPQLEALIAVCLEANVQFIILAGGVASGKQIAQVKAGGAKCVGFAPAIVIARRLIKSGIDALIIEGNEAGGHIGPVTTSVLAQEILPHVREVPVFVAGGIGRGEVMLSYLEMGAAGVQLGTRFVCAHECQAHPNFKQAFIKAQARDAVVSAQIDPRFPVIPVRALNNEGVARFQAFQAETIVRVNSGELDLKAGQLAIEHYWAGALRRAVVDGDVTNGSLMAGQSVGMVTTEQPVAEIMAELIAQAETALSMRTAA